MELYTVLTDKAFLLHLHPLLSHPHLLTLMKENNVGLSSSCASPSHTT